MDAKKRIKELERINAFLAKECRQKDYQIETLMKEIQKLQTIAVYK